MDFLVVVKHAGVLIDLYLTEHPDVWAETEGKQIRQQFPSAKFAYLNLQASAPEATKPTVKRAKAE